MQRAQQASADLGVLLAEDRVQVVRPVVDHPVGAQRAQHGRLGPAAAQRDHVRACRLGQLHDKLPRAAGRGGDQDGLLGAQLAGHLQACAAGAAACSSAAAGSAQWGCCLPQCSCRPAQRPLGTCTDMPCPGATLWLAQCARRGRDRCLHAMQWGTPRGQREMRRQRECGTSPASAGRLSAQGGLAAGVGLPLMGHHQRPA